MEGVLPYEQILSEVAKRQEEAATASLRARSVSPMVKKAALRKTSAAHQQQGSSSSDDPESEDTEVNVTQMFQIV